MARNTLVFVLNRAEWFKKVCLELVGGGDSDWPGDSGNTPPKCYGISLQWTGRDTVQPGSETDSDLISVHAKRNSTQPVLAQENCWDLQHSSRNFTVAFQFVSRWVQTRQDTFYSAGDQADSNTMNYDAWQHNSGYERNVYLRVEWKRRTTLQIFFTKHLDVLRTQSCEETWVSSWMVNGTDGDD